MIFMRCYLHDAYFKIANVRLRRGILRISLQRERWELYRNGGEMESISSRLVVKPVLSLRWESKHKIKLAQRPSNSTKFYIRDIYLGENYWDSTNKTDIVLNAFGINPARLGIVVQEPFYLRLIDATTKKQSRTANA